MKDYRIVQILLHAVNKINIAQKKNWAAPVLLTQPNVIRLPLRLFVQFFLFQ